MGFSGNSLLVEACIVGLLFWIASAKYKVVYEEISLRWDSFESEQLHVMHSSASDLGAQETCVHEEPKSMSRCWLLNCHTLTSNIFFFTINYLQVG